MHAHGKATLLSNASATGSAVEWKGGKTLVTAEATWGGGTVKLQVSTPNGTYVDMTSPAVSFTANGAIVVDLPPGLYKGNVATATAVYMYLISIPT